MAGGLERLPGIEPESLPWQGSALPLSYNRMRADGRARTGHLARTGRMLYQMSYDGVEPWEGFEPATVRGFGAAASSVGLPGRWGWRTRTSTSRAKTSRRYRISRIPSRAAAGTRTPSLWLEARSSTW